MDDPNDDPRQPTGAAAAFLVVAVVAGAIGVILGVTVTLVALRLLGA